MASKEKITNNFFKPTFYCVIFPNESVLYSSKAAIPSPICESLLELYGGTQLKKLPLEGKDFRSLRQLYFNKKNKGILRRRPVNDSHPINGDVEKNESSLSEGIT